LEWEEKAAVLESKVSPMAMLTTYTLGLGLEHAFREKAIRIQLHTPS
jgi:hypothetical protein